MFHDTARLASDNWYILFGALAAVLAPLSLTVLLRPRRRARTLQEKVASGSNVYGTDLDRMLHWLPQEGDGERRRALRRSGQLTRIRVARTPGGKAVADGLVLDRSTGGLGFAVEQPFRKGDVVFLWVAGGDFPRVAVTVRHCRNCGDYFQIGCEFRETGLPLTVLLQFG
jgi:hypothetical protein